MVSVYITQLTYPGFPKGFYVSDQSWSLFFCLGYSILKILSKTHHSPSFHHFLSSSEKLLTNCCNLYQTESPFLNNFLHLTKWISQTSDQSTVEKYIESFDNTEFVQQVLITGKCVFFYLLQNENPSELFNSEPLRSFVRFCEFFECSVKVLWDGGEVLYTGKQESIETVYVFYGDLGYVWMVEEPIERLDRSETQEMIFSRVDTKSEFRNSDGIGAIIAGHPKLVELIKVMSQTIVKHQIYSQKVQDALQSAVKENGKLGQLEELKGVCELKPPICEKHQSFQFITLFCKKEHCQVCVFEKIKNEFRKDNFKICCSCDVQIPPKMIREIKQMEGYKEFSKNYKKS